MSERPYKFLDFYTAEDADVFAGRLKETDILLSDILASKLVVLYARTGSGKSSLINAGVRPELKRLEYASVVVRVERDPVRSARSAFSEAQLRAGTSDDAGFKDLAREAARIAGMPVVVFLDQFEEFFIYVPQPAQQTFITDLAEIYRDETTDVHVVLSMREEFFYQLDSFRDHIPRIFHKESNLRLRPLSLEAAKDAVQKPAAKFGVTVDEALAKEIVEQLAEDGQVEPARLQIVCDTLWNTRSGQTITSAQFQSMGGSQAILRSRLTKDLDSELSDDQLKVIEPLINELSSNEGTKKIRAVEELKSPWTATFVDGLIERLIKLRMLRESYRDKVRYIEWTSDYLAEHASELSAAVHLLWLNRLVGRLAGEATVSAEEFRELSRDIDKATSLSATAAEKFLELALRYSVDTDAAYARARAAGAPVLQILRDNVADRQRPVESGENAVRLLGRMTTPEAYAILEEAFDREDLAYLVISVLAANKSEAATQLLKRATGKATLTNTIVANIRPSRLASTVGGQTFGTSAGTRGASRLNPEDAHIISERLADGKLLVFLGPDFRAPGAPTPEELVKRLSDQLGEYGSPAAAELPTVAQMFATAFDRQALEEEIADAYPDDADCGDAHRMLAAFPGNIAFVTTNFDSALERAFREAGRPLQVVTRFREALWRVERNDQVTEQRAEEIDVDSGQAVLFKLCGAPPRRTGSDSDVFITDEDYFGLADPEHRLPRQLAYQATNGLLFLGVRADSWYGRLQITILQGGRVRRRHSFVASASFSAFERRYWEGNYAKVFDEEPAKFLEDLRQLTGGGPPI